MLQSVGKLGKKEVNEEDFVHISPEAAHIVESLDLQNSPEDNQAYQAYQLLNVFFAKKAEQAWNNEGDDDQDKNSDEEDDDDEEAHEEPSSQRTKGMSDILDLTARLPTQGNSAEGSGTTDDPTAKVYFSQAHSDYLNNAADEQEKQVKAEQEMDRGKSLEDKKGKKDNDKKGKVPIKKKEPVKPRTKKGTGTTPTKDDKQGGELAVTNID